MFNPEACLSQKIIKSKSRRRRRRMLLENEEKQPKTTSKALRHTIATNLVDEKAVFEAKSEKSKHYKRSWK